MIDDLKAQGKIAASNCEPLYLSKHFMQDGHTANKPNGTITYVKYRGMVYGITCAHVYFAQELGSPDERILTTFGDRLCYQFGQHSHKGYESLFRPLRTSKDDSHNPDIAIVKLNNPYPSTHMEKKGKVAIDLETWTSPNWDEIEMAMACGFPTEHKSQKDGIVSAELAQVLAETTSKLSIDRDHFLLASSLEEESHVYFSGMSGGPVYIDESNDKDIKIIGIIYEGSPGCPKEWKERAGDNAILTNKEILIKAHTFTPDIFEQWLKSANYL